MEPWPARFNAVAAALPEIADRIDRTPLSPSRLWEILQQS